MRSLRCLVAAVSVTLLTALTPTGALAAPPMAKTSAPGYFRMMLGDFEITALSDGTLDLAYEKLMTNIAPETVRAQLKAHHLTDPVETSMNAYLVHTGSKLILIDTGNADLYGPTVGKLIDSIRAAGYTPEQIDEVYVTHLDIDHMGGLSWQGRPQFPRATVRVSQKELDFRLGEAARAKAPEGAKKYFDMARDTLRPYLQSQRIKPFDGPEELTPGIRTYDSCGHTPGHTAFLVESRGRKLLLVGDVVHIAAVQLDHPEATIAFDADPAQAIKTRRALFDEAAREGYLVGATHFSFPGLGYLRTAGRGYQWLPLNYLELR